MAADGLAESNDEAEEVFAGVRVVEATDIVWGEDLLGWGLEEKRRREGEDLLRLRDRSEDDGLLGIVGREVDGGRANWAIVGWRRDVGPYRRWWKGDGGAAAAAGGRVGWRRVMVVGGW